MLKKGTIVKLSNGLDYYVVEEILFNGSKYYYLASPGEDNIEILFVTCSIESGKKKVSIVSSSDLIKALTESLQSI